jgi:hypothetical protein
MKVDYYNSPELEYCQHCNPGVGCLIHKERNEVCSSFGCLWYIEKSMPEKLRPDILGVMIEVLPNQIFLAFPTKKEWKTSEVHQLFTKCTDTGHPVVIYSESKPYEVFLSSGYSIEMVMNGLKEMWSVKL